MSDYAYVADRAKKAFASVSKLEAMLMLEPENRAVQINLSGMRKMAAQARSDMENLARLNFIEVSPIGHSATRMSIAGPELSMATDIDEPMADAIRSKEDDEVGGRARLSRTTCRQTDLLVFC